MQLQLNNTGSFTVLQLTDLHIGAMPFHEMDAFTFQHMKDMVEETKPDLVVVTGDLMWSKHAGDPIERYKLIIEAINNLQVPVAITYGNHDAEKEVPRSVLRELEAGIDRLVEKKHLHIVEDRASFVIEIKNEQGVVTHVLYILDSGDYDKLGISSYDYVHPEQVAWFHRVSENYKVLQRQEKVDIVFLHIPLPEYHDAAETSIIAGVKEEGICAPTLNSGLFTSILRSGMVEGVFCGHDHDNDFIATYHGIKLGYGRVSGFQCYGKLTRGARVFTLREQQPFDTHIVETKNTSWYNR